MLSAAAAAAGPTAAVTEAGDSLGTHSKGNVYLETVTDQDFLCAVQCSLESVTQ
jgi:hypothetical protein